MPATGWWYDYFKGDSINVTSTTLSIALNAGEYRLLSQKKLAGFIPKEPDGNADLLKTFALPNPFHDALTIYNPFEGDAVLDIYDLCGRKIGHQQLTGASTTVDDASQWYPGYYLLKLGDGAGNSAFQKLLKK